MWWRKMFNILTWKIFFTNFDVPIFSIFTCSLKQQLFYKKLYDKYLCNPIKRKTIAAAFKPFIWPGVSVLFILLVLLLQGVEPEYATFLISLIGITNTIGRVLSGFIADLPWVSPLWVNNTCIIMSGLCVFFTPFASSYTSFVVLSLFFGFFVCKYWTKF